MPATPTRCPWGVEPDIYRKYHDEEWGRATTDDRDLFEKICLEGFQSGLSWLTILNKRENFRRAFAQFDPVVVASFDQAKIEELLQDSGIVRHAAKIRSTINNARRCLELIHAEGSLSAFVWGWADHNDQVPDSIPASTPTSAALAKELKSRGWSFVGPTTVYAFMQAMGLVNDHIAECHVRVECSQLRRAVLADPG